MERYIVKYLASLMMDNTNNPCTDRAASGIVGNTGQFLNIAQWNSQSLMPKRYDFELLLNQGKIGICVISETWLSTDISLKIRDYNIFRNDRSDSYGGVAIIVHKTIKAQACSFDMQNEGIEILHVKVRNCKYLEHVVGVYCPSSVRTSQIEWERIFSKFSAKTVVAGDFNGHHTNWSYKNDNRGSQLFEASLEHNFVVLNTGEFTRVKLVGGSIQESAPDITFVTSDIAIYFTWKVTQENLGSDHLLVISTMQFQDSRSFIKRRNFKKANWKLYRETLDGFDDSAVNENTIQDCYDLFVDRINTAADKCMPFTRIGAGPIQKFVAKPYWCSDISQAIAERRLALKTFRRNPTTANYDKLKNKIAAAQRVHRKIRTQNWQEFCSRVDETTKASEMWQKMRWMKGLKRPQSYAPEESKEALLRALGPDFVQTPKPDFSSRNALLGSEFTYLELEKSLKKKNTAPGEDGITYSMLYYLPSECKVYLLKIYNFIFKSSQIPSQWRKIKVVPIPKANSDPNSIPKLRPISLISCICKILHSMICKRLEWFVERNQVLSPITSGFRRNQSCLDCLSRLVSQIQIGFSKGVSTLAVFLDVENAYNNILIDQLLIIMDNLGVGFEICNYFWSFLNERILKICSDEGGEQDKVRITRRGLAQGDPISPLLFNIATHKVASELTNVFALQYADDFVIYAQNRDAQLNAVNIQNALSCIVRVLEQLGLQVSSAKTQCCHFKRGIVREQFQIKVNDEILPIVGHVKYLGMWLDRSLTWGKHVNEIVAKTTKTINLLKILSGATWGLHPKHIRRLYIALIRSRMDFGCFLYDVAARSHLYKLDKIQNTSMRVIGGFIRSTPIHVMEVELCIYPLNLRRHYLATKYCLKARFFSSLTTKIITELSNLCESGYWTRRKKPLLTTVYAETQSENIVTKNTLCSFTLHVWVSQICTDFIVTEVEGIHQAKNKSDPRILKQYSLHMINVVYRGWYQLYTDGSKMSEGIGAAILDPRSRTGEMYKIESNLHSIMSVELLAISEALSLIRTLNCRKVVIFTDSRSALQHIARCTSDVRGASVAYEILRKVLFLLENGVSLRLQWIPSHVGIQGNEEVDKLAKEAIETGSEIYVMPEISELLCKYRLKIFEKWKSSYDSISINKGIWYKILQEQPAYVPWWGNCKLKRKHIVMAHRLRSGHIPLNKFKYLMKITNSPNCDTCGVLEDVQHLLVECERSESMRAELSESYNFNLLDTGVIQIILAAPLSDAAIKLFRLVLDVI